jgi:uncharacterized membrane protein
MNASQTKNLRYAGMGFAVAAIAFAATGNWLLALSFAVLAIAFIVNSTRNRSGPEE